LGREVELIGLPGNWIIDANGKYTTVVPKYWTGTIVPRLNKYRFMPDTLFINYLQEDLLDQDFTGTLITSVTEPSNSHIQIYPNPSPDGNFRIRLPKNMKPIYIQLFDLAGQKLSEPTFAPHSDATEISINGKGFYLLKIITANGFELFKVSVL
jgi:hypothetical protein